ncbi:MAG TPA: DipZ protein [Solirubrobacteraceae bacterium]|nr:DipZ protein [Solirubrobacteraceae bacterium]
MRAPVDHIAAPRFPPRLQWVNGDDRGPRTHPMLVEFWDFCRPQSIRTLPYVKAWHERYPELNVIGVHTAGFPPSADPEAVRAAVGRLEIAYPVAIDSEYEVWDLYGNLGWPARYLFDQRGMLVHYHYGEGGYEETERAIQELLGIEQPVVGPFRVEEAPDAVLEPQTDDVEGAYSGPYRAGGVWAVLDGRGAVTVNGRVVHVDHPGCYELIAHERSTEGELRLEVADGVRCHAVCFTPGVADGSPRS